MVSWMQGTDCGLSFHIPTSVNCPSMYFIHCVGVILTAATQPAMIEAPNTIARARPHRQDRASCFPSRLSSSLS